MAVVTTTKKKKWFITYAIPKVADEMSRKFLNASFTFNKVPLLSHLAVASNVATPAGNIDYPFNAATDDCGFHLLCGYTVIGLTYYICDPLFRRTLCILPPDGGFNSRRTIGFIRNLRNKQVMVAELNSWLFEDQCRFTLSCTVNMCKWVMKEFACNRIGEDDMELWRCDGVLSHEWFLWWFDLSFCVVACEPFEDTPVLYKIMFPPIDHAVPFASFSFDGDIDHCLKVSNGSLRYVQIHGNASEKLGVTMWTLSSNNPVVAFWQKTHEASFLYIWNHKNYTKTPLRAGVIPMVALVHPKRR
ncbi:hypothetical protein ZWY2020_006234 [Hordeum vulgare]|nr:hypothetical protein ZWY2020_006234 [Hordeum vulgare]